MKENQKHCLECDTINRYEITLTIETREDNPEKWDWTELLGEFVQVKSRVDLGKAHT